MGNSLEKKDEQQAKQESSSSSSLRLSKSRFNLGLQCLKALYLKVHEPELAAPVDASLRRVFDQGTRIGAKAQKGYPGGVLIEWDHFHTQEALQATSEALAQGVSAIFEAAFFFHNTLVRIDILRNNGDGTWDIIEVKSSTSVKDEHIPDLTIQRYVAEGSGLKIRSTVLKHISRECVFPDLSNLFKDEDCTARVAEELRLMPDRIDQMLEVLHRKEAPKVEIGVHCDAPYQCPFKKACWAHIPEYSIFELHGVWASTKFDLYQSGLTLIKELAEDAKISRAKSAQIQAVKSNAPVLDTLGLQNFLKELQYPLRFFDFETYNSAIPQYDGLRPYDQLPFQFSCHLVEQEDAKVQHFEFLADGSKDPRRDLVQGMLKVLGSNGTILAYNMGFEKSRINELAKNFPEYQSQLLDLLPRFKDLKDAFTKHYYHPDFHGSLSIKDVLPVLVPTLSYKGMEIMAGDAASAAYGLICDPQTPAEEKTRLRKALLEYCEQDTYAMVLLHGRLKDIAGTAELKDAS